MSPPVLLLMVAASQTNSNHTLMRPPIQVWRLNDLVCVGNVLYVLYCMVLCVCVCVCVFACACVYQNLFKRVRLHVCRRHIYVLNIPAQISPIPAL